MKPSNTRTSIASDNDNSDDDLDDGERRGNAENRKLDRVFCVGARVERDLDGLWFPATIVRVDEDDGTFELEYDEDHNRETDITAEELRCERHDSLESCVCASVLTLRRIVSALQVPGREPQRPTARATAESHAAAARAHAQGLALAPDGVRLRPEQAPDRRLAPPGRVARRYEASSHDRYTKEYCSLSYIRRTPARVASGYIINGLETNIAAGNGLRGIRWLRVNTF